MTAAPALTVSLVAALAAWSARALTRDGAVAATAVGGVVLWGAGWPGAAVLGAFFLPSTLVGRLGGRRPDSSDARGERRDAVQVLANGAVAALGGLAARYWPDGGFWMLTCALACASADTWATSIGRFSAQPPRLLGRGIPVARGSSGAVSGVGTLGGLAGGAIVAGTAALAGGGVRLGALAWVIGVAGMLLDSLLGATLQARFHCAACDAASERRIHRCGAPTELVGGWRWLGNDAVNAVSTLAAGLAGGLAWALR